MYCTIIKLLLTNYFEVADLLTLLFPLVTLRSNRTKCDAFYLLVKDLCKLFLDPSNYIYIWSYSVCTYCVCDYWLVPARMKHISIRFIFSVISRAQYSHIVFVLLLFIVLFFFTCRKCKQPVFYSTCSVSSGAMATSSCSSGVGGRVLRKGMTTPTIHLLLILCSHFLDARGQGRILLQCLYLIWLPGRMLCWAIILTFPTATTHYTQTFWQDFDKKWISRKLNTSF